MDRVEEPRRPRRVLMFAKLFPPCNCWPTASERAAGLARGLADLGWTPVVITRQLPPGGCTCGARDGDVENKYPGVEVIRAPTRTWPHRSIPAFLTRVATFVRAAGDDWTANARRAAHAYLEGSRVDLVWTTSGPIVSARLGRSIQRDHHLPWIAELRDSLSRSSVMAVHGNGAKARLLRMRASLLARSLRRADAVVHVSLQEAQADRGLMDQAPCVIPSAFDDRAWSAIHAVPVRQAESEPVTLLFAGRAYPGRIGYSIFFEGVRQYARTSQGSATPIRVEYIGPTFARFRSEADRSGVAELLMDRGVVSLARSRDAMRRAGALLLVTAPDGYAGSPGGKLYEYLAACRPILAVPGTDEFVADVLQHSGHGVCVPDAEAVRAALERLAAGTLVVPGWPSADLDGFTWAARARQLARIFGACLGPRPDVVDVS